jgi:hypothetical protein
MLPISRREVISSPVNEAIYRVVTCGCLHATATHSNRVTKMGKDLGSGKYTGRVPETYLLFCSERLTGCY